LTHAHPRFEFAFSLLQAWRAHAFADHRHPALRVAFVVCCADGQVSEYTDNDYGFAFQFPSDWKMQKTPPPADLGEIRVIVKHPAAPMYVEAIVAKLGSTVTKREFEANPKSDAVVGALTDVTIEQVYKKMSKVVGAERMIVAEKRPISSSVAVEFYIATGQFRGDELFAVAGIHAVPYGKPYMVSFIMVSPADKNATADNETMTRVFNSFHIVGEQHD
jgi:hypothetical protein